VTKLIGTGLLIL